MADALLSAFLDQLASAICYLAEHEVKLVMGVGDAIESLKKNLEAIKLVLKDAEKKQWQDDAVKFWMDELKDISYDMDGVLDEWGTAILKTEIEKDEVKIDSFVRKIKVHFSALCRCSHFGPLSRVRHRLDISHKIENLNGRLDSIASRKDRFGFSLTTRTDEPIRSEVTTSIIDVSKVFGQDTYKKNLIGRLLCEGSQEGSGRNLHIIPVVGMGGIGKTTLAKMVFNDDAVKSHFGKRIWICVSDTFDLFKIAGEIIEQLTGQAPRVVGLEALMQNLIASIKDAKFLLILDDVWTEDYQQWEPLKEALLRGAIFGSRVVVTTRKVEVARMMGVGDEHFMIRMKELSETDCWSLFSEIAFFGRSKEDQDDLAEVGREIVCKCNGLPLAAKTLGSLLRTKRTKNEWLNVLQSEIWRLERVREKLFFPLLLSYFDLSPIEKCCFSYCASFPKDHDIRKDDLIYLWMAQGFFSSLKDANEELIVAERCFETLAMCSFFQDFKYLWEGRIVGCKMHDIVHDFAQFITSDEYATLPMTNIIKEKGGLSARHLTFIVASDYQDPTNPLLVSSHKNLQSLMFVGRDIVDQVVIDSCLRFISLRTLRLEVDFSLRIPESIGDLIQLRYLSLSLAFIFGRRLRVLPSKLGNLCKLQTLILEGFFVPKEVVKLINLRVLQCTGGYYTSQILPKGIGRIKNLQTLTPKFSPSTENNVKEKFQLGDLGGLSCLRQLRLVGVAIDQGHIEGATQARLHRKTNLVELIIEFAGEGDAEIHEAVLEALQPPPNLEILHISFYGGAAISPRWLISSSSSTTTLNHLKMLTLESCNNCETLPPLGHLQSLEVLKIWVSGKVKKVGPEFLGITDVLEQEGYSSTIKAPFPKLKRLEFYYMDSWCEWAGISGWDKESTTIRIMPCLEYLTCYRCGELEALPEFLETTPLKELVVAFSRKLKDEIEQNRNKFQHIPIIKFE